MKRIIIFSVVFFLASINLAHAEDLSTKLNGRFLLQVEAAGKAWYVNPLDGYRYSIGNQDEAFVVLKKFGLGISNSNFSKLSKSISSNLLGRIIIKVEDKGKAYYIDPTNKKLYYLENPKATFDLFRQRSLGIADKQIAQIPTGIIGLKEYEKNKSGVSINIALLEKMVHERINSAISKSKSVKTMGGTYIKFKPMIWDTALEEVFNKKLLETPAEMWFKEGYDDYQRGYEYVGGQQSNTSIYNSRGALKSLSDISDSIIKPWLYPGGFIRSGSDYGLISVSIDKSGKFSATQIFGIKLTDADQLKLRSFSQGLVLENDTDLIKIRKIYSWITNNISYDEERLKLWYASKLKEQNVYITFVNRKGVCADYSALLTEMLRYVGIKSRVVSGLIKSVYEPHAWNMININGEDLYLDATWDTGAGSYEKYFLIPEKCMKIDHSLDYDLSITSNYDAQMEYVHSNSDYFDKHCPNLKKSFTSTEEWIAKEAKNRFFELTGTWQASDGSLKIFNYDGTCSIDDSLRACNMSSEKDDNGRYAIGASGPDDVKVIYANDLGDKVEVYDGNNFLLWTMSRQ